MYIFSQLGHLDCPQKVLFVTTTNKIQPQVFWRIIEKKSVAICVLKPFILNGKFLCFQATIIPLE